MINISRFREYMIERVAEVNALSEHRIAHLFLGVREEHLVKKLRDSSGICLCVSYPDAESTGSDDCPRDTQKSYLFLCAKVAPGALDDEQELLSYRDLQQVMLLLRNRLRDSSECININPEESFRIEWEYQIFGGFNGLSMSLTFNNYD